MAIELSVAEALVVMTGLQARKFVLADEAGTKQFKEVAQLFDKLGQTIVTSPFSGKSKTIFQVRREAEDLEWAEKRRIRELADAGHCINCGSPEANSWAKLCDRCAK